MPPGLRAPCDLLTAADLTAALGPHAHLERSQDLSPTADAGASAVHTCAFVGDAPGRRVTLTASTGPDVPGAFEGEGAFLRTRQQPGTTATFPAGFGRAAHEVVARGSATLRALIGEATIAVTLVADEGTAGTLAPLVEDLARAALGHVEG